jgi:pyruvate ferredoxin oxidoreductase gamma subunit
LRSDGYLLVNSSHSFDELGIGEFVRALRRERLASLPATDIALARIGRPVPNTVLIAGLAALTGIVSLDSVVLAIRGRFSGEVADGNVAAAAEGYERVRQIMAVSTDA